MLEKGRIGSIQLLFLFLILEGATSFLYAPSPTVRIAGRDSWLSISLIPSVYAMLVVWVGIALARRFPFQVLTEYLPEVAGKTLGKLLATGYTCYFIILTSAILSQSSSFVQIAILRETPPLVLNLILSGVAACGAYLGIEVIARQNELVWPLWAFSIVFLAILALKDINCENFLPFLENGVMPVVKGGTASFVYRGEAFLVLMLFPYLNQKNEAAKAAGLYLIITTLFNALAISVTLGVFGDPVTSHMLFPYYELARYISIARFFERFQSLIVVIWIAGTIVKLAGFYHTCSIAAATTLGSSNQRLLLLPITVITLLGSSLLYDNFLKLVNFLFKVLPYNAVAFQLLIPSLILLVSAVRNKGGKQLGNKRI